MKYRSRLPLAATLTFIAFTYGALAQSAPETTEKVTPLPGFDKTAMDTNADPCVDFYQYACGNFAKLHPIPADLPEFDQFVILSEFNTQALGGLVEKAGGAGPRRSVNEQKVGDFYGACVDIGAIEKEGLRPVQPALDRIAALKRKSDLFPLVAHLNRLKVGAFFDFGSQQDLTDATREIAYADQGGLGLWLSSRQMSVRPESA